MQTSHKKVAITRQPYTSQQQNKIAAIQEQSSDSSYLTLAILEQQKQNSRPEWAVKTITISQQMVVVAMIQQKTVISAQRNRNYEDSLGITAKILTRQQPEKERAGTKYQTRECSQENATTKCRQVKADMRQQP